MSNPPYGGVELPFLKGDLEGFLNVVAHPLANGLGNCARRLTGNYKIRRRGSNLKKERAALQPPLYYITA